MKSLLKRSLSPLLGLLLFLQSGLVVSGGAVRLTGSGLGCPTWPRCTSGSYAPVPHQAQGQLHAWIEFGNRLISVALVLVALAVLVSVLLLKRHDIRALAIGQFVGIFGQIPLGGITVLTHLNPFAVASHFLLSIVLIAAGTSLFSRRRGSPLPDAQYGNAARILGRWQVVLTAVVIVFGTVVTGAGPNAGDVSAPRFHIHIQTIAWLHGSFAIALLLISVALYFYSPLRSAVRRRIAIFATLVIVQGAIGYIQFNQGFPELLVGIHLLGVTLIWVSSWRIRLAVMSPEKHMISET